MYSEQFNNLVLAQGSLSIGGDPDEYSDCSDITVVRIRNEGSNTGPIVKYRLVTNI